MCVPIYDVLHESLTEIVIFTWGAVQYVMTQMCVGYSEFLLVQNILKFFKSRVLESDIAKGSKTAEGGRISPPIFGPQRRDSNTNGGL